MQSPFPRYHYLDQIRAHMMFLGVVFHSIGAYLKPNPELPWSFTDPVNHSGLFVLLVILHLFRMPVFFIVAGFFCALMLQRWGPEHLLRDRARRILLPFLVLAIPVHLLCQYIVDYGATLQMPPDGKERVFDQFTTSYLWFLYYLSILYGIVLIGQRLIPARVLSAVHRFLKRRTLVQLACLFGIPVAFAILALNTIFMPAPLRWTINPLVMIYYAAFFMLGMALHGHAALQRYPTGRLPWLWLLTLVPAAACAVTLPWRDYYDGVTDTLLETVWGLVFAVAAVSSSLLVISLYQRYMAHESALGRYIADSSYWVYLAHFPLTMIMPMWLYDWTIPPTLKFVIVVVAVIAICLVSYHLCVRYTWIGAWLNGKKPPRQSRMTAFQKGWL